MDERELTKLVGRHDGRIITSLGLDEINNARVRDKISLSISRIDVLSFQTIFDIKKRCGLIPVNISFFPQKQFSKALAVMKPVFKKKIAVSELVAIASAGEKLGEATVPEGKIGLATVCSIIINGVLLKHGIPIDSKFGGILQVKNGEPLRFVELINYSGSSLDPSEIFIRGKMTSVREVVKKGEGKILANFREIPSLSHVLVEDIMADFSKIGIGGAFSISAVGNPICQTDVDINKVGMILVGGLNPVAAAYEEGFDVDNKAMSRVMEYEDLCIIEDL
jgi:repressor of nif and glnA expression